MMLSVSFAMAAVLADPPAGGVSPLAWTIIVTLGTVLVTVTGALWRDRVKTYDDLKACNREKVELEEEILGLLKVLRIQMEQSKGGRQK
jgi:hypothetical protein